MPYMCSKGDMCNFNYSLRSFTTTTTSKSYSTKWGRLPSRRLYPYSNLGFDTITVTTVTKLCSMAETHVWLKLESTTDQSLPPMTHHLQKVFEHLIAAAQKTPSPLPCLYHKHSLTASILSSRPLCKRKKYFPEFPQVSADKFNHISKKRKHGIAILNQQEKANNLTFHFIQIMI